MSLKCEICGEHESNTFCAQSLSMFYKKRFTTKDRSFLCSCVKPHPNKMNVLCLACGGAFKEEIKKK